MCNYLHLDSQPIPKSGKGWKIFERQKKRLLGLLGVEYVLTNDWVKWDKEDEIGGLFPSGDGFCFFLTKEEADRVNGLWNRICTRQTIVVEIEYDEGLGTHTDKGMMGEDCPVEIALCKAFRVIGEGYELVEK